MALEKTTEVVHTARVQSPIGELRLATTAAGLAFLELPHSNGMGFTGWLRRWAPGARVEDGFAPNQSAAKQMLEYLAGKRRGFDLALDLRGTDFQLAVWRALFFTLTTITILAGIPWPGLTWGRPLFRFW